MGYGCKIAIFGLFAVRSLKNSANALNRFFVSNRSTQSITGSITHRSHLGFARNVSR